MAPVDDEGPDLRDLVRVLRRRGWILLVCAVVVPVAVYLYSLQLPEVYESQVLIQPQPAADAAVLTDLASSDDQSTSAVARFAETSSVAQAAARALDEPLDSVSLESASVDENTGFVTLTAQGDSPRQAAEVANAFAQALSTTRERRAETRIDETLTDLREQVEDTEGSDRRRQLGDEITRLKTLRTALGENVQVIEPAAPGSYISPSPRRNAVLGLIVGLLLGIGLMLLGERFDRRLRKPEDVEEITGVPLLATIPKDAFPGGRDSPHVADAFQNLRDGLMYFNVDRKLTRIMVASPLKGDGKTTVAINLATSLARSGRKIILVDADLRAPQVAKRLGLEASPGLTQVLAGGVALDEALVDSGDLRVLPAGAIPPNPSELIGSQRMKAVLDALSGLADVVVVDTTPLLVVSDAFPLLDQVSGVVALAKLNQTPAHAVRRMLQIIATAGGEARVLGMVATGAGRVDGYGYGYGYGDKAGPSEPTMTPVDRNGAPPLSQGPSETAVTEDATSLEPGVRPRTK